MDRLFIAMLFLASASPWAGVRSLRGVGQKADGSKVILWDVENPIFRIDNTEHVMDVRLHQQVHIICPEEKDQKYIIYNVNKEDYQSCRVSDPKATQVALCDGNGEDSKGLFTITFRTFSPSPTGLEFQAGKDYYFITTSGPDDIGRKIGGRCQTHNMKVIFKVKGNSVRGPAGVTSKFSSKFQRLNRKVHGRREDDIVRGATNEVVSSTSTFQGGGHYYGDGQPSMFSRDRFRTSDGINDPATMTGGRYETFYPSLSSTKAVNSFRSRPGGGGGSSIKQEASRQHQSDQPQTPSSAPPSSPKSWTTTTAAIVLVTLAAIWQNMAAT